MSTIKGKLQDGVCDACGGGLHRRDDDSEETVRRRLEVHRTRTGPVIDHYRSQGLPVTVSAPGKVDEVTGRAVEALPRPEQGSGTTTRAVPEQPLSCPAGPI